jgi:cobalamin transport system substrate-binding protein
VGLFCCVAHKLSMGRSVKKVRQLLWRISAWTFVAILFLAANAHGQVPPSAAAASPVYREVIDEMGRTVRVPQQVKRIVSLAPSVTETIYELGLQDLLVGDTDYCDYPPDAQKKPKVGGAINPSIEHIVALKPDLVLVAKSSNRLETVAALERLGIPSFATDAKNVADVISSTEKLSSLLGAADAGAALARDLEKRLKDLQERLSKLPQRRVLFVVWPEPLISIGKHTFVADALKLAGATSIIDTESDWPQISLEEVVHSQPEFLVFAPSHSDPVANPAEALSARPGWQDVEAIKNHRVVLVSDAVIRPAPRIVSAIEEMAHQFHPEAFLEKQDSDKDKMDKTSPHPSTVGFLADPIFAERASSGDLNR